MPYAANWANSIRDDMEYILASLAPPATLLALAQEWRQLASHEVPTFATNSAEASNWPILCAWGWLVSSPDHENYLGSGTADRSHARVARERANDLAYRGIIP
jgi:hypothetical protein